MLRSTRLYWIPVLGSLLLTGCQSQLGTVYSVASGRTTAADVLPPRVESSGVSAMAGAVEPPTVTQASFSPPPLANSQDSPPAQPAVPLAQATTPQTVTARRDPLPEPTREQAMASVMDYVLQLGVENPDAQQVLLQQLQDADPGHYQLIARRFRSTLAYNRQLGRQTRVATAPKPRGEHFAPPPVSVPTEHSPAGSSTRPLPEPGQRTHTFSAAEPEQVEDEPTKVTHAPASSEPGSEIRLVSANSPIETSPVGNSLDGTHAPEPTAQPVEPRDWRESLKQTIQLLQAAAPDDPHTTEEAYRHARLRLLRLVADDLDGAVAPIPGLSASEQDYWSKQLFAVSTMLDARSQPESNRRAAAAAMHLGMAQAKLQHISSLSVRNLTFCDEVYAYGAYKERGSRTFHAGDEVTMYVEVENFRTEQSDKGHHTSIGTSYRVLDASGNRVDSGEFPAVQDYCYSRRRDFHLQYGIALPERVYPGQYQLELSLTDELGNKIGRASIDFEIVE